MVVDEVDARDGKVKDCGAISKGGNGCYSVFVLYHGHTGRLNLCNHPEFCCNRHTSKQMDIASTLEISYSLLSHPERLLLTSLCGLCAYARLQRNWV